MARIHEINLFGKLYPFGYKVVTEEHKSLGLRKNPNIHTFPMNEWYFLPDEDVEYGKDDWGGIWLARDLSSAKKLRNYMKEKYDIKTRIFKSAIDKILYDNYYRIKTNGIFMFEETDV